MAGARLLLAVLLAFCAFGFSECPHGDPTQPDDSYDGSVPPDVPYDQPGASKPCTNP